MDECYFILDDTGAENEQSFVESLTTHVIKNLRVKVENVHIRYEDNVTTPRSPFTFGITLNCLNVQTTDNDWKPVVLVENPNSFNKVKKMHEYFPF